MDRAHLRRGAPPSFRLLAGNGADPESFGQAAAILADAGARARRRASHRIRVPSGARRPSVRPLPRDAGPGRERAVPRPRVRARSNRPRPLVGRGPSSARSGAQVRVVLVTGPLLVGATPRRRAPGGAERPGGLRAAARRGLPASRRRPRHLRGPRRHGQGSRHRHPRGQAPCSWPSRASSATTRPGECWTSGSAADLPAEEIEEVRTIMRASGALEATLELVRELAELATVELAQVPLAPAASAASAELADQVAFRTRARGLPGPRLAHTITS